MTKRKENWVLVKKSRSVIDGKFSDWETSISETFDNALDASIRCRILQRWYSLTPEVDFVYMKESEYAEFLEFGFVR